METVIRKYFGNDTFAKTLGIELLEFSPGAARCKMVVTENHLNGLGKAHGGAIFGLADFTFAVASNSHGTVAVAIHTDISFVKAIDPGTTLFAEAKEESRNPKIGTYGIRITDDKGDIVAIFHGMVYRKKESITEFI